MKGPLSKKLAKRNYSYAFEFAIKTNKKRKGGRWNLRIENSEWRMEIVESPSEERLINEM